MENRRSNKIFQLFTYLVFSLSIYNSPIHAQEVDTVKIDELTVLMPSEDWEANREVSNKWAAGFYKDKSSFFKMSGITYLTVFKDSLRKQMFGLDENAVADSLFNNEIEAYENTYRYSDIKYRIYKTDRGKKYFAGKKFFVLEFESETNTNLRDKGRDILFWYFPDDFMQRHVSYGFQLLEYWYNDKIDNDELEYLYSILRNMSINDSIKVYSNYSQLKNSSYYSSEVSFGFGYANGFEKHVFNVPSDVAVNSATGINLNYCYYFNSNMAAGIRLIGYYKELPDYILTDPEGNMKKVKYKLFNSAADGEFRYVFSRGEVEPYGFLLIGLSEGNVSEEDDELSFNGFNAGFGAGYKIAIGNNWRLSIEAFGIFGTSNWEEKPFLNSSDNDFNPSMAGILLNVSYVFGKKKK